MSAPRLPPVVTLMGPTASGKSQLALELGKRIPIEIVSVDSAQVYRGMDIGTAKPTAAERALVPHHLIDLVDPTEAYSAARFRADVLAAITAIHARARLPLLVGGTMLYFKALRDGLSNVPSADPATRAAIDAAAATQGWPALHAELAVVDPATAARLNPNDAQRIQRALEVFRLSGRPLSQWFDDTSSEVLPFDLIEIAVVPSDRAVLHARIATRFDAMIEAGLEAEVRQLQRDHVLSIDLPSMRSVGYRQMWEFIESGTPRATLRERGVAATRQLAKRQLTWLRSWPNLTTIDALAEDALDRLHTLVTSRI